MKKVNALVLGLVILLSVGCGGDGDEPAPDMNQPSSQESFKSCMLKTVDNGNNQFNYTYNAQGKIEKIVSNRGDIDKYEYNSLGKVSRILILRSGIDTTMITTYEYNADSLVSKYISIGRNNSSQQFSTVLIHSFLYDAQKKVISKFEHNVLQPSVIWAKNDYLYLSNGNIQVKSYNFKSASNSWEFKSEAEYSFDNKKLPRGQNDVFISIFPHNILSTTWTTYTNGVPGQITSQTTSYTYNAAGYPTESVSTSSGLTPTVTKFTYDCQ